MLNPLKIFKNKKPVARAVAVLTSQCAASHYNQKIVGERIDMGVMAWWDPYSIFYRQNIVY